MEQLNSWKSSLLSENSKINVQIPQLQLTIQIQNQEDALFSRATFSEHLPNLLVYFPSPLNFFVYYLVKNESHVPRVNRSDNESLFSMDEHGQRASEKVETIRPRPSHAAVQYSSVQEKNDEKINRSREFEKVRTVIRELMEFWERDKELLGNSPGDKEKSFYSFLEWLTKRDFDIENFLRPLVKQIVGN